MTKLIVNMANIAVKQKLVERSIVFVTSHTIMLSVGKSLILFYRLTKSDQIFCFFRH